MTDTSVRFDIEPSPPARRRVTPSWVDPRFVGGLVLVLVSVLLGASVLSSADHRQSRWALNRDLSAGTVLTAADIRPVRVQLGPADSQYLPASEAVIGRSLRSAGKAGELLSRAQLDTPQPGVAVTVALRPENGPPIGRGDRITLWLTTKTCRAVVLLSGVAVQSVAKASGSAFGAAAGSVLQLRVSATVAQRVVSALDLPDAVLRAGLLADGQQPDPATNDLSRCDGARS